MLTTEKGEIMLCYKGYLIKKIQVTFVDERVKKYSAGRISVKK